MKIKLAAASLFAATLLIGCKGVDQRMTRLDYMPSKPAQANSGPAVGVIMPAEAHGLARNANGEVLVGDVVTRHDKRRAGVVSVKPLAPWVGKAVEEELRAAGVNAGLGLEAKAGRPIVKTEIQQVLNESDSRWSDAVVETTIRLGFTVERDGITVGTVDSTGKARVERAAEFKDLVSDGMEQALRDCLLKAMPRLVQLTQGTR